jgi:protein-tyrosine-phosphatase
VTVLFVCLHGSAKSVIAAEHLARMASERGIVLSVASAGLEPDDDIPPHVIAGLAADGFDVRDRVPRGVKPEQLRTADYVVSFGCDVGAQASQTSARARFIRWDDVPAVSEDYGTARSVIVRYLDGFLSLPPRTTTG